MGGVGGVGCGWGGIAFTGKKLMGYFFGIQEIMHSYHANSSVDSSKDSHKDSHKDSSDSSKDSRNS
jgi:hypothetical protein